MSIQSQEVQLKQAHLIKAAEDKIKALKALVKARIGFDDYADTMAELCQEVSLLSKQILETLEAIHE